MGESHSAAERLSAVETKIDQSLTEIALLRASFVSLEKYLLGNTKDIERMKVELGLFRTALAWVLAPLLGSLGVGAIAAIWIAIKK